MSEKDEGPIDLQKLAAEAGLAARADIRASKWCLLWHDWTRWQPTASRRSQSRWCLGCGKVQTHRLSSVCSHSWRTDAYGNVVSEGQTLPCGRYYDQTCLDCGDKRRKTTYTGVT